MRKLFIPLLAALALPTAVNAESYWLILGHGNGTLDETSALEKIEMPSIEACHEEGTKWRRIKSKDNGLTRSFVNVRHTWFACLTGK